jgi:hypothetical protein
MLALLVRSLGGIYNSFFHNVSTNYATACPIWKDSLLLLNFLILPGIRSLVSHDDKTTMMMVKLVIIMKPSVFRTTSNMDEMH